jgi:outer membrane protein
MENAFTVSGRDAQRTGFDKFTAGADFKDVRAFIQTAYRLTDRWRLTGVLSYARLFGDAADSPIVDDAGSANRFLVGLGAAHAF